MTETEEDVDLMETNEASIHKPFKITTSVMLTFFFLILLGWHWST